MALTANIAASAFPRCPRAASGIVGVLLAALVGCEPPRASNYNVNEHNFLRAWAAGADAQIATILGTPDVSGEGEVVQVPGSAGAEVFYSVAETCDQPDKDRFRYFRGVNNEQIRLLVSRRTNTLIAAEYLVDGTPVFYLGPKAGGRMLAVQPRDRARGDAEFLARKKQVVEFFNDQLSKPAATAAASPSADNTLFGQPDGLRYSIFDAQLKDDTLVVSVKIENITDLRKVSYAPCRPTLADFAGNAYASKGCSPDCGKSLYPHETHVVDYTFEKPVPGVESFSLTFSRPVMDPRTHSNRMLSTVLPLGSDQIAAAASDQPGLAVGAVLRRESPAGGPAVARLPAAFVQALAGTHGYARRLGRQVLPVPAARPGWKPSPTAPRAWSYRCGAAGFTEQARGFIPTEKFPPWPFTSTAAFPGRCGFGTRTAAWCSTRNTSAGSGPGSRWHSSATSRSSSRSGMADGLRRSMPSMATWPSPSAREPRAPDADEIHQQLKQFSVQVSQNGERLKKFAATIAVRARAMGGSAPSGGGTSRGPAGQFRAALNAAYKVPVRK